MMQFVGSTWNTPVPAELSADHSPTLRCVTCFFFVQGSPASHRLFHIAILPYLARQLRSEELRETAEVIRKSMLQELEGRIVV